MSKLKCLDLMCNVERLLLLCLYYETELKKTTDFNTPFHIMIPLHYILCLDCVVLMSITLCCLNTPWI